MNVALHTFLILKTDSGRASSALILIMELDQEVSVTRVMKRDINAPADQDGTAALTALHASNQVRFIPLL